MKEILRILRQVVTRGLDLLTYLSREGDWSIRPHEMEVITAVIRDLDVNVADAIQSQLQKSFFVERIPDGRINIFRFYDKVDHLRIREPEYADLLIKAKLEVDGQKQIVHMTFHKGIIFSIEFKKPGKFYAGKEISISDVKRGSLKESYTLAIDRIEHGTNEGNGNSNR